MNNERPLLVDIEVQNQMFFYKVLQKEERFEIKERGIYIFFNSSLANVSAFIKSKNLLKAKKCKR